MCGDRDRDPRLRCTVTHLRTPSGVDFNRSCRRNRRGRPLLWAIDSSSRRFSIAPRPDCRGAIFLSASAHGNRSTIASQTGLAKVIGRRSSVSFSLRSMRPVRSSMAQSCARIKTRRAEKGDPMQCFGTLSRRCFDQNPRRRRHERPPDPHRDHAGPAARNERCS